MDLDLIANQIKNSNHNAFKIFYHHQFNNINDFIFYKTRDRSLSMDISQEVFSRLWINRANIDLKKSLKSYLLRIAHNLIIDHYRKKTNSELSIDDHYTEKAVVDHKDDRVDSIYSLLEKLPVNQRDVFLLSKIEGLTYKEISEIFNVSQKTVDSWMQKAIKFLRKNLLYVILFIRNLI